MDAKSERLKRRREQRRVADENRKRAVRACERCRRRKNRCMSSSPGACERCKEGSFVCIFPDESGFLEDESRHPVQAISPVLSSTFSRDELPETMMSETGIQDEDDQTTPQDAYGLSGGLASSDSRMWSGFLLRLREAFGLDSQPGEDDIRLNIPSSVASRRASLSQAERQRLEYAISGFPPWPVARFLFNVCIEHGTDSFFYFDQAQLSSDLDRFYHDTDCPLRSEASFLCLALGVFALGSQWTTLIKPEGRPSGSLSIQEDTDPGRRFYSRARPLMGDIVDSTSIRSVQAAYVISVYLMPASAIGPSYVYMGLALRKAIALEMHLHKSDPAVGKREEEVRRRLWWSIYSLERTVTIKLNRPSSISQDVITAQLPRPSAEIDAKQQFDNVHLQIANARLVRIIDKLLGSDPLSPERHKGYEAELKNWKRSLPPSARLDSVHPRSSEYRAVVHLYLNYHFAWIALGKVSVVTAVRSHVQAALRSGQDNPSNSKPADALGRSCIKSAKKMLQLFEGLTCTENLTRFSFTDFQGCSIATVILLLSGIINGEDGDSKSKAIFGLECLRRMTGGNTTAMMGVCFVEALQSIADEATAKLAATRNSDHSSSKRPSTSDPADYAQWTEWLTKTGDDQVNMSSQPKTPYSHATTSFPGNPSSTFSTGGPVRTNFESGVTVSTANAAAEWEQDLGEQDCPPSIQHPMQADEARAWQPAARNNPMLSTDFQPAFTNDDHLYLMGLTGLDVLNFDFDLSKPHDLF